MICLTYFLVWLRQTHEATQLLSHQFSTWPVLEPLVDNSTGALIPYSVTGYINLDLLDPNSCTRRSRTFTLQTVYLTTPLWRKKRRFSRPISTSCRARVSTTSTFWWMHYVKTSSLQIKTPPSIPRFENRNISVEGTFSRNLTNLLFVKYLGRRLL